MEVIEDTSKLTKAEYRALVQEGKGLILQGAAGRLRLGEIAQKIAPKSDNGGDRRSDNFSAAPAALNDYAAEIDIDSTTLREYRDITLLWGGVAQAPKVSWSVLRELAREPDPKAAFAAVKAEHGKVNILTVRTYRNKKTAGVRSTSPVSDRVAQVREALNDEEVAKEFFNDFETVKAVSQAHRRLLEKHAEEANEAQRKRAPGLVNAHEYMSALSHLSSAKYQLSKALGLLQLQTLSDGQRESVQEDIDGIRVVIGWIESYINNGDKSFDESLNEILQKGA